MNEEMLQILNELKSEIQALQSSINELKAPASVHIDSEYVDIKQAQKILDRKRTWINRRMLQVDQLWNNQRPKDVLVYGEDWHREGSKILIKRESLIRIKNTGMREMGERYQKRSREMYA